MRTESADRRVGRTTSPIFVVGASRSGTNLLRALLNEHSDVWISPETHYFDDLRPRLPGAGRTQLQSDDRKRCEDYFLALGHRAYGQDGDPTSSRIDREKLRALAAELGGSGDDYFQALCLLRARLRQKPRWGEKTPRHVYRITEMLEAFPDAKIICLVRDPRAVIASYRDWRHAGPKHAVWNDDAALAADRLRSQRSYNIILMSLLWRGVVRASHLAAERFGETRVYIQRFERLAADPEREARALCSWLELEYQPSMLAIPVVNSSYVSTGSESGVSSEPVERWRTTLSMNEIGIIERCCGAMMDELDYRRENDGLGDFRFALAWLTVPFAAARAVAVNRARLGRMRQAVGLRARLAIGRGTVRPGAGGPTRR
jgi:hypothetical protein